MTAWRSSRRNAVYSVTLHPPPAPPSFGKKKTIKQTHFVTRTNQHTHAHTLERRGKLLVSPERTTNSVSPSSSDRKPGWRYPRLPGARGGEPRKTPGPPVLTSPPKWRRAHGVRVRGLGLTVPVFPAEFAALRILRVSVPCAFTWGLCPPLAR